MLNDGGSCGQRLSVEPGKQNDGVVYDDLQPSIGEPKMASNNVLFSKTNNPRIKPKKSLLSTHQDSKEYFLLSC